MKTENMNLSRVSAEDTFIEVDYLERGDLIAINGEYAIVGRTRIENGQRVLSTELGELEFDLNARVYASL